MTDGFIMLNGITMEQSASGGIWLTYPNVETGQLETKRIRDIYELGRWMWFQGIVEDYYETDNEEV